MKKEEPVEKKPKKKAAAPQQEFQPVRPVAQNKTKFNVVKKVNDTLDFAETTQMRAKKTTNQGRQDDDDSSDVDEAVPLYLSINLEGSKHSI